MLEKQRKAKARIDKIKNLQATSMLQGKESEESRERVAKEKAIRDAAAIKIESASEVVKLLSTMSSSATAFTMRAKQLEEKKKREEEETEYQRRMDIIMEIDRLKDLKRRENDEKQKVIKRHEDRKIIIEQIEDREKIKSKAMQAKELENQQMIEQLKRYEEEDKRAAMRRQKEVTNIILTLFSHLSNLNTPLQ